MTLVERFIEFSHWSTSRKTAVLCGLSLPGLLLVYVVGRVAFAIDGIADVTWFRLVFASVACAYVASFLLSLLAASMGKEARWTAYVTVILIGASQIFTMYVLGLWSTPYVAFYPISVLVLALWYDEAIGWFAFIVGIAALAMTDVAQLLGFMSYAPGLLERSIDAHQATWWVVGGRSILLAYFAVAFGLCILILASRKLQDVRLQEAQRVIRRYVPSQLADSILAGSHDTEARHERRNLTIFFSDVEGFTNASDELDPEQLAVLLNEYLSEMATIAERHGATINQFVGDGIMIFFGAPTATSDKDHALRAVRMSLEMQKRMGELQETWFKRGFQRPFRIRIGINTGYASVGDFGSQGRVVYSAIGLQTNLAARIQAQCDPGKVLISHSTWALVHEEIACEPKAEIQVKGIHYPVKVYEVSTQQ